MRAKHPKLQKRLQTIKETVLQRWFDQVAETYPPETSRLLKQSRDPFSNPVGHTTRQGLTRLYDQLTGPFSREAVIEALDPIIHIRAVQSFSPSQAVGFIFFLKTILRQSLESDQGASDPMEEWQKVWNRIDTFSLVAFDLYINCRQKVYNLKVTTERNKIYAAFSRAGLINKIPEDELDKRIV